jgi:hypothetical protein
MAEAPKKKKNSSKMRRTVAVCRGAKGYGWFHRFQQHGQEGFVKGNRPTPFDWSKKSDDESSIAGFEKPHMRPRVVLSLSIDKKAVGDLTFELAKDIVPKTVENFVRLVRGDGEVYKGYAGTAIHLVRKGEMIMGGDIIAREGQIGRGNHSSYDKPHIDDENFIIPHSERGLLRLFTFSASTVQNS